MSAEGLTVNVDSSGSEEFEQFSYLEFFLNTYNIRVATDVPVMHKNANTGVHVPYLAESSHAGHAQVLHAPGHETMPHIPGPWFPSADNSDSCPFYCASMLALLKPWQDVWTLKKTEETFESAFASFISDAPQMVQTIVANIQYFHECADQAKRYAAIHPGEHLDDEEEEGPRLSDNTNTLDDPVISDNDILQTCKGSLTTHEMVYADVAMNITDEHDFFGVGRCPAPHQPLATVVTEDNLQQCLEWQHLIAEVDSIVEEPHDMEAIAAGVKTAPLSLSIPPSTELQAVTEPNSVEEITMTPFDPPSYLNEEQAMAFTIIADHLCQLLIGNDPPQLLMVIHGEGGTGKTQLLQAITQLFSDVGSANRLAKTALSGVAACQIGGKTLHSWGTLPAEDLCVEDSRINALVEETAKHFKDKQQSTINSSSRK
ncbi:uncharacterized protein BJ212DRAFT_1485890 [Suillus subaureus]|uniref:ATP-dependent DNA helicase n=1 Tax=Suillus subaureus TaxID=48587 RepID=A0A9P7DZD4_9AGAM|nr:uncharacterized protein BJ212DRAFT_1485890 [Suillus subaureus]KAG1807034.1 hypothetical protein BJ212DRAFT_1485890 [Suillus subaureus]